MHGIDHGKPVTTTRPSSLRRAGINSAAGKSAFAVGTGAVAPIMSEAVIACLRLFVTAGSTK